MCKILTKNSQLFGENIRKCQRAFRLMVDILNVYDVNWVVALNYAARNHQFWTGFCITADVFFL